MTLTEAANTFRNTIKFGWLIIFLPLVVKIILTIMNSANAPDPGATPPPVFDAAFGQLPALVISNADTPTTSPQFNLDLLTATFPANEPIMEVFPIISAPYGFLSRDKATDLAKQLFFEDDPKTVETTKLQWSDRLRKLTMDATNLHFEYDYNFIVDPTVFSINSFVSEDLAVNTARDLLARLDILEGSLGMDLDQESYIAQQLRFDGTKLVQSTTLFNTSAIRVDYFRDPIDTTPIVSPHYYISPVNITISSKSNQPNTDYYPQILELNYAYWRIDSTKVGTYPIISGDVAYTTFQQNHTRYLVFIGEENDPLVDYSDKKINIVSTREAELSYFSPENYQQYLQPVWVFKGKATVETGQQLDFVAYVPAISAEWLQ